MTTNLQRAACAAAIATGISITTLPFGVGPVNAAPMPNPPSPTRPAVPGVHVQEPTAPTAGGGVAPPTGGGGPKGGQGGTEVVPPSP
jgi:hypothetical protein